VSIDGRLSREELARDRPIRAFGAAAAVNSAGESGLDGPQKADTLISDILKAGYRTVEDNIQEGRRTAERLRAGVIAPADNGESAKAVANRVMHLSKELSVSWIELIVTVLRDSELRGLIDRVAAPGRPAAGPSEAAGVADPGASVGAPITHRVSSRQPIEVTLSALPAGASPAIGGLHSLNPATPPITRVGFHARDDGGLELRIDIDDSQPPGAYAGAVVDAVSLRPIGALSVRILE